MLIAKISNIEKRTHDSFGGEPNGGLTCDPEPSISSPIRFIADKELWGKKLLQAEEKPRITMMSKRLTFKEITVGAKSRRNTSISDDFRRNLEEVLP